MIRNLLYYDERYYGLTYDARNDKLYFLIAGPTDDADEDGYYLESYEIWGIEVNRGKLEDAVDEAMTDEDEELDFDYMLDLAIDENKDSRMLDHWDDCRDEDDCKKEMRELCGRWWK